MSAERAIIQSVKNDVITIALPYLAGAKSTYLTASVAALGTTLTVKDNTGFVDDDYLVIGDVGTEQAEIKKIGSTVTRGTSITIGATIFAHGNGTRVTKIPYNQVRIYGSTTAADSSPTVIGSAEIIDISNGKIEITAGTTYAYYYARYYNSNDTVYSEYSDSVAAAGLDAWSRGELKKEFLSMFNERTDDLISDDWMNRTINRWQRELTKRKKQWSCLRDSEITDLTEDLQAYALPSDIYDNDTPDSLISVKVYNEPDLTYWDNTVFRNKTSDYIGTTVSTAAAVADTTLTLTDTSDITQKNGTCYCKGVKISYALNTESTGVLSTIVTCTAITVFADAGDDIHTVVTAASHGYTDGDTVYIGSTRNYDGSYTVSSKTTDTFEIVADFVADDATGACSTVDDSITEILSVGDEVWQTRNSGQPTHFTVDNGYIKLDPMPDGTFDLKNLTIEYWKKFDDLADDADSTVFHSPENCLYYMYWQASFRRKLKEDIQLSRESRWRDDLEKLAAEDGDFQDIRIQPRNLYKNPY